MANSHQDTSDAPSFSYWLPPPDTFLSIGENEEMSLPQIPIPLVARDYTGDGVTPPSERLIGEGIYEYLCNNPDCEYAGDYVDILRRAYPFLIADLGSQLLLLDFRKTEVAALKRKIALLKIMRHLEPYNFGLLHKLGIAFFDLALHKDQLEHVRGHLQEARRWFELARRQRPDNVFNLTCVGRVCYLSGNYHQAKLYFQSAIGQSGSQDSVEDIRLQIETISAGLLPQQPLVQTLEQVGLARRYFDDHDFAQAHQLMEEVVLTGDLTRELPDTELYYFIGLCREKAGDHAGAYEALTMATERDEKHEGARQALARVTP